MANRAVSSFVAERHVAIPMRDGVITYADVYRPAITGKYPVILERTPYDKSDVPNMVGQIDLLRAMEAGYCFVVQDCRGRFESGGDFKPFYQEVDDGYDSVEWCASQSWSNGRVGMIGLSYVGATQWLAAIATPPHLSCIVPCVTSADYYDGWMYQGGALMWSFVSAWILGLSAEPLASGRLNLSRTEIEERMQELRAAYDDMCAVWHSPRLMDVPLMEMLAPFGIDWLEHSARDEYWKRISIRENYQSVQVPALIVGGWYDIFREGTLENFMGLRDQGGTADARSGTRLLIGPWGHDAPGRQVVGERNFGMAAGSGPSPLNFDQYAVYLRFFDRWLKDGPSNAFDDDAPVRIYVINDGWRDEGEWPLKRARHERFFLHSNGNAGGDPGDGWLDPAPPDDEPADRFEYDPADPVPTIGGQLCCHLPALPGGPFDQRSVETRPDVLLYTSRLLDQDVEVTGPVRLELFASTSAADTDFTAKLVDVEPDGRAINVTDGIARARYRGGTDVARPVEAGRPSRYDIEVGSVSYVFRKGHRFRIEVSSSNFPRFDRNRNSGLDPATDSSFVVAHQGVFHGGEFPSRLILSTVPR